MTSSFRRQALALATLSLAVVATMGTPAPYEPEDWSQSAVIATDETRTFDVLSDSVTWDLTATIDGASEAGLDTMQIEFEGAAYSAAEGSQIVLSVFEATPPEKSSENPDAEPVLTLVVEQIIDVATGGEPASFGPSVLDLGARCEPAPDTDTCVRRFQVVLQSASGADVTIEPEIWAEMSGYGYYPNTYLDVEERAVAFQIAD
jgi:hypothetical protein